MGQQASFKADVNIPVEKLARVVNNALCGCEKGSFAISPVRIVEAEEKPPEFHARFDARGKTYIYKIRNTQTIDIFQRNYVYHVAEPLDTDAMRQAAKLLAGTHDFKSFEASGSTPRESTVRTIYRLNFCRKKICWNSMLRETDFSTTWFGSLRGRWSMWGAAGYARNR